MTQSLPNTQAYLNAILGQTKALSPSPPQDSLPGRTSFDSSHSSRSASSKSDSGASADDEISTSPRSGFRDNASAEGSDGTGTITAQDQVLRILNDVDEDDQPEKLKELLSSLLPGATGLDEIVLGLLHRHREDLNPTGQKFENPPPLIATSPAPGSTHSRPPGSGSSAVASVSRSGSLRKSTHAAATLALQRSNSGLLSQLSRPSSPSPLRAGSPSSYPARNVSGGPSFFAPAGPASDDPDGDGYAAGYSSGGEAGSTKSPFGSPRMSLHVGASEFRPKSAVGSAPGSASGRARSPLPAGGPQVGPIGSGIPSALNLSFGPPGSRSSTPGAEGRNVWAFNPSPLGTPKFAGTPLGTGALTPSRSVSGAGGSNDEYFGLEGEKAIPRDPWNDEGAGGGVDARATAAALEAVQREANSFQRGLAGTAPSPDHSSELDPFSPFSSLGAGIKPSSALGLKVPPKITTQDADAPLDDGDASAALEWGLSPAMAREMERFSSWDPFESDFDAEMSASAQQNLSSSQQLRQQEQGLYAQGHASSNGGYTMTPFDELWASVAGTGITPEQMEDALIRCGYDANEAMDYLIRSRGMTLPSAGSRPISPSGLEDDGTFGTRRGGGGTAPNSYSAAYPNDPTFPQRARFAQAGSGNRPTLVARDSFDRRNGGRSPIGSAPSSPRWGNRPLTPTGETRSGGPSNRVCRFYLQGACLRSDCRFSHDVSKAVCRFWLRGHCLKGENRCDFAHEIPHVLNARLQMLDAQNEGRRSPSWESLAAAQQEASAESNDADFLEFPSLGEAAARRGGNPANLQGDYVNDPSRTRWAGAVKNGRPVDARIARQGLEARKALRSGMPLDSFVDLEAEGSASPSEIRPRQSGRISLRPPALLPTLPTGSSLAQLYSTYRSGFLELGAQRNRCFQRANECFKRGDGAGARRWSREGAEWNKRVIDEGRAAATAILAERNRLTKDAVTAMDRSGRADETSDRMHRGREMGGGVCLGVAHPQMVNEGPGLSVKERMEVAMDLHGLHPDEGIDSLERFLLSLHQDGFIGLAYVVVGEAKHTGSSDPARGTGKTRLADAIVEFLALRTRYPWKLFDGVVCIDPCL